MKLKANNCKNQIIGDITTERNLNESHELDYIQCCNSKESSMCIKQNIIYYIFINISLYSIFQKLSEKKLLWKKKVVDNVAQ